MATTQVRTGQIGDGGVTLADMADLAQDQFIGRTSASTGVPQTATITAFARTFLDDVDAAAARTTLGATATGHTHDGADIVTGTVGTDVGGTGQDLSGGAAEGALVWLAGVASLAAPGTSGWVLTAQGIGVAPAFAAAGGVSDGDKGDITVSASGATWTVDTAAITLAKMANLAQDQFIGRTTASTGVPQTATITAAARTVLKDTTVAEMVDTLGGAVSTGTGGLVRATSPAIVTPTIASFANANHNHTNAAGGGQISNLGISNATETPGASKIVMSDGFGLIAAGWLTDILALSDLSDVAAKTGTGSTVVMSASPTLTGTPVVPGYATLVGGYVPLANTRPEGPHDYAKTGTGNYTAYYCANIASGIALTTLALVANRFFAVPFVAPSRGGTLDQLEVYVTTGVAATSIYLGIYNNSNLYPSTLLLDAGTTASATSATKITKAISQALTPGQLYWLVCLSNGAPTIRAGAANGASMIMGTASSVNTTVTTSLYAAQTYGALPANFPGTPTAVAGTAFPGLFYRFSA